MSIIERGICKITALNSHGQGVGNIGNTSQIAKVSYTLPGETISFKKYFYRGKTSFILDEILNPSKERISPPCKYFTICGGCSLQHLTISSYLNYKFKALSELLVENNLNTIINPLEIIGKASRRRAIFEAVKKDDQIFLGFKKFHSDKIVNIDSCLVLETQLSKLIEKLKPILNIMLKNRESCKVFITKAVNGIDLIIERKEQDNYKYDIETIKVFAVENEIIRFTVIDSKWHKLYFSQSPYVIYENIKVKIDNHSFLQVSAKSDLILARLLNNILNKLHIKNTLEIVDLFCGRGTLTIPAIKFGNVDGYELEPLSVKALKEALTESKLDKVYEIHLRNLFSNPLKWDELNKYDVTIINPPRIGAKEQSLLLGLSTVKTIIYLSCNPESFIRDAKLIMKTDRYILQEITPIDQFYWNSHLEVMAVFKLK